MGGEVYMGVEDKLNMAQSDFTATRLERVCEIGVNRWSPSVVDNS